MVRLETELRRDCLMVASAVKTDRKIWRKLATEDNAERIWWAEGS
jgi:hypothetical protein